MSEKEKKESNKPRHVSTRDGFSSRILERDRNARKLVSERECRCRLHEKAIRDIETGEKGTRPWTRDYRS